MLGPRAVGGIQRESRVDQALTGWAGGRILRYVSACRWSACSGMLGVPMVHGEHWWPGAAGPGMTGHGRVPALPLLVAVRPCPAGRGVVDIR